MKDIMSIDGSKVTREQANAIQEVQNNALEEYFAANATDELKSRVKNNGKTIKGALGWMASVVQSELRCGKASAAMTTNEWAYGQLMHYMEEDSIKEGDTFKSEEEKAEEARLEAERKAREEEARKTAEEKAEAARKAEEARIAAMTEEERVAYENEKKAEAARKAEAEAEAKRKAEQDAIARAAKDAARKEKERKTAARKAAEEAQLTFAF